MRCEVLVSTMNQKDYSLIKKMKINSDAIFINQSDYFSYEELKFKGNRIKFYSFKEKGVGLSRNNALMRATNDIIIFADEDEIFVDDYDKIIESAFEENKKADMILFNVDSLNPNREQYNIKKVKKLNIFNCGKYGAVRFAIKLDKLQKKNIFFSLLFGGGAKYQNGEDSLFLMECIKSGIKVYTSPRKIGSVKQEESSWFVGYDEKFFNDRGILYKSLYGSFYSLMSIRFVIKNYKNYKDNFTLFKALSYMINSK